MSAVCSTSFVRFLLLSGRQADLSGARDEITATSFRVKTDKTTRAIKNGEAAVRIFVHPHGSPHVMLTMALPRNLEAAPVVGHAVVGADHPILLNAENVLDRTPDIGHEGRAWLGRGHRKARVVVGNETFFKVAIAPRNRPDFCEPQFLRQPLLQRAEHPLHSPAPLR